MIPLSKNSKRPTDDVDPRQSIRLDRVKSNVAQSSGARLTAHRETHRESNSEVNAKTTPESLPAESPSTSKKKTPRSMVSATLFGQHTFHTESGQKIHISSRDGKYMARGRVFGQQVGLTLGDNEATAHQQLCLLLADLANGSFVRPSEARWSILSRRPIPLLTLRQLCDDFLKEKMETNGSNYVGNYLNRLQHILEFAEQPVIARRWKVARVIDREFAIELRRSLMGKNVTRNGRCGAKSKKMSTKMVRLCLEALITALNWAKKAQVRKLPADFFHPFTEEILGQEASKDPLRSSPVPIEKRIHIVGLMNRWQLVNLTSLLIIPTRFEDVAGAVISDFDLHEGTWKLGSRFDGSDFNKGRVSVVMPLPPVLIDLFQCAADGRGDGPMFLQTKFYDKPKLRCRLQQLGSRGELEALIQTRFDSVTKSEIATPQGRKKITRKLIHDLGAVSTDDIARQLKCLFAEAGVQTARAYDIRHATTQDMNRSGMSHLAWRYFTLHKTNDILNTYSGVGIVDEMARYFNHIAPLLQAIERRARELEIPIKQVHKNVA